MLLFGSMEADLLCQMVQVDLARPDRINAMCANPERDEQDRQPEATPPKPTKTGFGNIH